jgi:hypothetical protein
MEFESIRPILSGLAGGIIATWLTSRWSRSLPRHYGAKSREALLEHHRVAVYSANALFLLGLCTGITLYPNGGFAQSDWRPFGLGFGIASVLPLLALAVTSWATGRNVREAYVAFAWGQGTPISATYGILGAGVVTFFWAVISLGT